MGDLLSFMGAHPWLSFFCLFPFALAVLVATIEAIKYAVIAWRGYPPPEFISEEELDAEAEEEYTALIDRLGSAERDRDAAQAMLAEWQAKQ